MRGNAHVLMVRRHGTPRLRSACPRRRTKGHSSVSSGLDRAYTMSGCRALLRVRYGQPTCSRLAGRSETGRGGGEGLSVFFALPDPTPTSASAVTRRGRDSSLRRWLMENPTPTHPISSDVLHSTGHSRLSQEEIAKAVARHQREHPGGRTKNAAAKPQKTTPRR